VKVRNLGDGFGWRAVWGEGKGRRGGPGVGDRYLKGGRGSEGPKQWVGPGALYNYLRYMGS
jgi:hypothetical protein